MTNSIEKKINHQKWLFAKDYIYGSVPEVQVELVQHMAQTLITNIYYHRQLMTDSAMKSHL